MVQQRHRQQVVPPELVVCDGVHLRPRLREPWRFRPLHPPSVARPVVVAPREGLGQLRLDSDKPQAAVAAPILDEGVEGGVVVEILAPGRRSVLDEHPCDGLELVADDRSHQPRRQIQVVYQRPEEVDAHRLAGQHVVLEPVGLPRAQVPLHDLVDFWGEEVEPALAVLRCEHVAVAIGTPGGGSDPAGNAEHLGAVPALVQAHPPRERIVFSALGPHVELGSRRDIPMHHLDIGALHGRVGRLGCTVTPQRPEGSPLAGSDLLRPDHRGRDALSDEGVVVPTLQKRGMR